MLNASSRDSQDFSGEVQVSLLAGGLCLVGALALMVRFAFVRSSAGFGFALFLLNLSPTVAVLLISVPLGFLYGRLSLSNAIETDFSIAETLTLLNDITSRQMQSGNPRHVNFITNLARETEAAKQVSKVIRDKIWQVRSQLSQPEIQDELAVAIGARQLRVWVKNEEDLRVGCSPILEFRIEPFPKDLNDNSISAKADVERQRTCLVYVVSNQVEVEEVPVKLVLPDVGASSVSHVSIKPKTEGRCSLTFLITTYPALELLQSYTVTIQVLPSLEGQWQ